MIRFRSDNTAGVSAEIMEALQRANRGDAPAYGADEVTLRLRSRFSELFETEAWVFPVSSGIAANGLALSAIAPPFTAVACHASAHLVTSENGAAEFFTHGARLVPIAGDHGRVSVARLGDELARGGRLTHLPWSALSLTQLTEAGTVYRLGDLEELARLARAHGARVHMDGARFANAIVALGCTPAQGSRRIGVDVLSFGATKNGALGADAVVVFDRAIAESLSARARRAGQNMSKMRFLSAQLEAYVARDLWLRNAGHANVTAARLAAGLRQVPGVELLHPVDGNEIFAHLPGPLVARLEAGGHEIWASGRDHAGDPVYRLVTSFQTTAEEVDAFVAAARAP